MRVLDEHHLVEVWQGAPAQQGRAAQAVRDPPQRHREVWPGQLERLRCAGRRQAVGDELAHQPLPVGRVLLVLDEGLGQEEPAKHVMPSVTDDRELALPEDSAPDANPAKLREYELREPLAA
jgi:hypothetical protein